MRRCCPIRDVLTRDRKKVADIALQGIDVRQEEALSRAAVLRRLRLSDTVFRILTRSAALAVLALLGGVIFALFAGAWRLRVSESIPADNRSTKVRR